MKLAALSLALCALTATTVVGQMSQVNVPVAGRTVALNVQVTPASTEKLAHAAAERAGEPDGVMVQPMPGSGYVLRTEKFKATGNVTTMAPNDHPNASAALSDSTCTTRWTTGRTAHSLVSMMTGNENMTAWSHRHQEALFMITAMFAPNADASAPSNSSAPSPSNHDVATTPWTDTSGNLNEVTTRRHDGESRDAWLARHDAAVKAFAVVLTPAG